MSEPINDGGPAFPIGDQSLHPLMIGMSLRDYFAAHAMIALHCSDERGGAWEDSNADWCAKNAYKLADAMLKVREVNP